MEIACVDEGGTGFSVIYPLVMLGVEGVLINLVFNKLFIRSISFKSCPRYESKSSCDMVVKSIDLRFVRYSSIFSCFEVLSGLCPRKSAVASKSGESFFNCSVEMNSGELTV